MSERLHEVRVRPLPPWLDATRLLGDAFTVQDREAHASIPAAAAALLSARLRGLGLDGAPLEVSVKPPLSRTLVREGRLQEARARRETTPGFTRPGVHLDEQGRFSLTPESLALALGLTVKGQRVLDACCGAGGNSIGFARAGCEVIAIELDAARARDARHNAAVYGVAEKMRVIEGDASRLVPTLDADVLFIDPPWGRDYDKTGMTLASLPLLEALLPLTSRFARTLVKVPMSFDTRSVPGARASAVFGEAKGDAQRIKHVLLEL